MSFLSLTGDLLAENVGPDYRDDDGMSQNFFSVFGVFFTAVTGIVAGANLSGDLKVKNCPLSLVAVWGLRCSGVRTGTLKWFTYIKRMSEDD